MVKREFTNFPSGFDHLPPNSATAAVDSSPEQGTRRKRNQPEFFKPPIRSMSLFSLQETHKMFLVALQETHKRDSNEVSSTRPQGQIVKPVQQPKNEARTINPSVVVPRCERNFSDQGIDPNILQHVADALHYMTVTQTSVHYENVVHTLQAIHKKYGDITKDCSLQSDCMRSFVLIGICNVVQDLENKWLEDLDISSLDSYYNAIRDAEIMNVNVQWLHKRLDEIKDALTLSAEGMLNERNARLVNIDRKKEDLLLRRLQLEMIKSDIEEIEEQLGQEDVVVDELCKIYADHMSRIS